MSKKRKILTVQELLAEIREIEERGEAERRALEDKYKVDPSSALLGLVVWILAMILILGTFYLIGKK